jgi:hypothetical protein
VVSNPKYKIRETINVKLETQIASILQLCSDDLLFPLARRINKTPIRGRNVTIDRIGQDDSISYLPNPLKYQDNNITTPIIMANA